MKTAIEHKCRPISLSDIEVRAIQKGQKTQIRRVLKHKLDFDKLPTLAHFGPEHGGGFRLKVAGLSCMKAPYNQIYHCPYGIPGGRLWVREAFAKLQQWEEYGEIFTDIETSCANPGRFTEYRATNDAVWEGPWKSSSFMPRSLSRITLEITDIRVERLQDISEEDAIAEGIESEHCFDGTLEFGYDMGMWYEDYSQTGAMIQSPVYSYQTLWDFLNTKKGIVWGMNPWIWAITVKVV